MFAVRQAGRQAGRQADHKTDQKHWVYETLQKMTISWQFWHHLYASGGSRACLLRSILAAGGGLGPHVGGPWRCQGLGLGPEWPEWAGWHSRPGGSIVLLGSRDRDKTAQVGGDLMLLGATVYQSLNIGQSAIRLGR